MGQCITGREVVNSFIANAPLISTTIDNMTVQAPSWFRDLLNPVPWPERRWAKYSEVYLSWRNA